MKGKKKKYLSKFKCFNSGKMGNYLSGYSVKNKVDDEKRKGKKVARLATSSAIDDLTRRLE